MDSTFWAARSPRRMIAPRPNCFSIWRMAASTARPRSPFLSTGTWATATGASICRSLLISRVWVPAALGSLLVAGLLALLAPRLDHLDRCRRLVRGRRRELRRLLLGLALRLLTRSISALCHRSNLLFRAGRGAPIMRHRPLPTHYPTLTSSRRTSSDSLRFYASPRDSSCDAMTILHRCHTPSYAFASVPIDEAPRRMDGHRCSGLTNRSGVAKRDLVIVRGSD